MKLERVYCGWFPQKGFTAFTIFPFVFIRKDRWAYYTLTTERHEMTHALQQLEMLWLFFFILYGLEWVLKLPFCKFNTTRAYYSISFEQEAYDHQEELYYNEMRKHYSWMKYLFKIK